jgi:ribonucleoside-triphosphate reductase (thioredoxin)
MLENFEMCNLSEVFPPRCSSKAVFERACEYATFYCSTVSLIPTHLPESNAVICRNRRIGVSISGIAQWVSGVMPPDWGPCSIEQTDADMREAYCIVRLANARLANEAGVRPSIRITTVKPSGTISLLAGCTPGVHHPIARYCIRRVRVADGSPLVPILERAGVPSEPDVVSSGTRVFEFVVDHGNIRSIADVSIADQFAIVKMAQSAWSDNSVSCTVFFAQDEVADISKCLRTFFPSIKAVSLLPHMTHGYAQAPYEPISKDEYDTRVTNAQVSYNSLDTSHIPVGSLYCTNDTCL